MVVRGLTTLVSGMLVLIRESRGDRGLVRLESGSCRPAIREEFGENNDDRVGLLIRIIFKQ